MADLDASLRFYCGALGFLLLSEMEDESGKFFAAIEKDGFVLLLSTRMSRFLEDAHAEGQHEHDEHGEHRPQPIDVAPPRANWVC